MKIFRLTHTLEAPPIASTPDPDLFTREILRDLSKLPRDASVGSFQMGDPGLQADGFYRLSNSVLVYTKEVYLSPLGYSLDYSGNVHPSKINSLNEEIFFLNVTAFYNCLDVNKTVFLKSRGEEMGVDHGCGIKAPAFFPKLIGDSKIFHVPQLRNTILVASDGSGREEDFYTLYKQSGYRGLEFIEVWDG